MDDGYGWGQCLVDDSTDHTAETCYDTTMCPKEVYSYVDWMGVESSHVSYGFCEHSSVCHAPALTKEECKALPKQNSWDEFPKWYVSEEPTTESFALRSTDHTKHEHKKAITKTVARWRKLLHIQKRNQAVARSRARTDTTTLLSP